MASKSSPSSSPNSQNNHEKNVNAPSKFPTLERLFFSEESDKDNNSITMTQNIFGKIPSKLFHSTLNLAENSIKSDEFKEGL